MLLKVGSRGSEVQAVQQKLGLHIDGIFGEDTKTAVQQWQAANGLSVDGMVGDDTWGLMFPSAQVSTGPLPINKLAGAIPQNVLSQIPDTAAKFNITNKLRLAHFLSQCAHESANWKATVENLNYSANGLRGTFGKYFPNGDYDAYARNQPKIGARVYANRMGNGDEASGEGYAYRGRGYIQLTGKNNYTAFSQFIGVDCVNNPDAVANDYPLASAAFYFNSNNLWPKCDQGSSQDVITTVTRAVNGGTKGLDDRIKHFNTYWALLNG